MTERGYPAPRVRPPLALRPVADVFERAEPMPAFVATADAEATLVEFSGVVDHVLVSVFAADAVLRFTTRDRPGGQEVFVAAGANIRVPVRCDTVRARSAAAGLPANVRATGFWARRSGVLPPFERAEDVAAPAP